MATLTALPHVTDPDLLFGAFEITASTARSRYATEKGRLRTALVSARGIHQEAVVLGQSCSGLRATAPMHGPDIARAPIDTEFARRARICSGPVLEVGPPLHCLTDGLRDGQACAFRWPPSGQPREPCCWEPSQEERIRCEDPPPG